MLVMLVRKAMKDFTSADGTFMPKVTCVAVATQYAHHDETSCPNAHASEPFRFADLHPEDKEGVKHQFATTTAERLPFGHGRHGGRVFLSYRCQQANGVLARRASLP